MVLWCQILGSALTLGTQPPGIKARAVGGQSEKALHRRVHGGVPRIRNGSWEDAQGTLLCVLRGGLRVETVATLWAAWVTWPTPVCRLACPYDRG